MVSFLASIYIYICILIFLLNIDNISVITIYKYLIYTHVSNSIYRLKQHLNPGGRLYIVGMNPIADHSNACDGAGEIVTEVRRARDACILLAGHRPYR